MKKIMLSLILGSSLFSLKSISPFSVDPVAHKNPLAACENCNDWIENKLIELLDHTIAAKRYWLTVGDRPWYRVLTRPIHHWYSFSWQTEIREHLSTLEDLQNTLATALSKHIARQSGENEEKEDIYNLVTQANTTLKTHGIPLHILRHWLFYIGSAVVMYKATQLYQDYLKDVVVLTFNKSDKDIIIKGHKDCEERDKYSIMQEGDTIFVTTRKDFEEDFLTKLEAHSKIPYSTAPATFVDLRRILLDENGQFLGKTFIKSCFITPIQNIWKKLKNDNSSKEDDCSPETKKANIEYEEHCMRELLNTYATWTENGQLVFPQIAKEKEFYTTFEGLKKPRLKELLDKVPAPFGEYFTTLGYATLQEFLGELAKAKDQEGMLISLVKGWAKKGEEALTKTLKDMKPQETYQYKWIKWKAAEFSSEYPTIKHNVLTFVDALEFLTETVKMSPFFLTLYVGYKGTTGAAHWYRDHYFKEPLRYDLKDCINFLDENLYTHVTNPSFKGLHYYWTVRLKRYKSFMDSKNRIYFEKDLQKLTRGATISHEIETLRAILYNELEHF